MRYVDYEKKYGPALVKVWRDSKQAVVNYKEIHDANSYLDYLENVLVKNYKITLCLDEYDSVLGFIVYNPHEINQLYIQKDAQGGGIGKAFVNLAKAQSNSLNLYTFQENEGAIKFYQKQGFSITESGMENEEALPDFKMQWTRKEE